MKKWFEFFCLSFFSHKISKEGAKRGYATAFLGLILALIFLWVAFMGGDMTMKGDFRILRTLDQIFTFSS